MSIEKQADVQYDTKASHGRRRRKLNEYLYIFKSSAYEVGFKWVTYIGIKLEETKAN